MIQIAVDAYGGDFAPVEVIKGVKIALEEKKELYIYLVGNKEEIEKLTLDFDNKIKKRVEIIDAKEVVRMSDKPSQALRLKNSSMKVGISLIKEGKARAFMTAGNSGAAMAISMFTLGRIRGVSRPAIGILLPTLKGEVMLIDVGANVDCKPQHLLEFAIMGSVYVKYVVGVKNPRVGILSNGSEPGKGNQLVISAYGLLSRSRINFVGNVEGDDIYKGKADVVVTDGFVGNVVLKVSESIPQIIGEFLKEEAKKSIVYKLGFALARNAFRGLKKRTDYAEFGGAPLLGVNGACIISHGRSNAVAIKNAIFKAVKFSEQKVNDKIEVSINKCKVLQEFRKGVKR